MKAIADGAAEIAEEARPAAYREICETRNPGREASIVDGKNTFGAKREALEALFVQGSHQLRSRGQGLAV